MPSTEPPHTQLPRAWYASSILDFLELSSTTIYGELAKNSTVSVTPDQKDAWLVQIEVLQQQLIGLEGSLFLEFHIPRMGRRVDVVIIVGPVVFAVEFKVFAQTFDRNAIEQTWDYALDLKNFHESSHHIALVPILVATDAAVSKVTELCADHDFVYRPLQITASDLGPVIESTIKQIRGHAIDEQYWLQGAYRPTPSIIEAAKALYAHHGVEAIRCFDAGRENLARTSKRVEDLVDRARITQKKLICFVTGVPGAGKTLVGLDIATDRREPDLPTHAVFLSGNGPLVEVLRAALTRDEKERRKASGDKNAVPAIAQSVQAFIQNVHHFRDHSLRDLNPPHDRVVIFDEAQRAWNQKKTSDFMTRRRNRAGFAQSEPEFLISCMDRHQDWAVIVCLVGGGQEIHTGEAGIAGWLEAIHASFPDWEVHISSRLTDSEYAAGDAIERLRNRPNVHFEDSLHLAVSMRSFRSERVSAFVKALLDLEVEAARLVFQEFLERYPIAITRSLEAAKLWLKEHARGSERYGLVASSKALRLKPHAVDVRVDVNPVHWFLNDRHDIRSSYYLEDAATEFQVQGLELDWICVTWDGDLRLVGDTWSYHDFRGSRWQRVKVPESQEYLRNAYRVLLTRARQGMVIFVPPGDADDPTRPPEYYDGTFEYLSELGLPIIG